MHSSKFDLLFANFVVVIFICILIQVQGRPNEIKRVSDHKMAEMETYLAISRLQEKEVTAKIAHGVFNIDRSGRRRRNFPSTVDNLDTRQEYWTELWMNK